MTGNHRRRSFRWLVTAAVLLIAALAPLGEAAAQHVSPPVNLNVPLIRQQTPVWCWLATSEMIIRYRNSGMSLRQCEMMEIGYGLPSGACCGNPANCMRTANGMQEVQLVLARFGGVSANHGPPLTPQQLYGELQTGHPVIAQIRTGMSSSHVVVIRGMRLVPQMMMTPRGPMMTGVMPILLINDPLSFLPSEVPYAQLAAIWMDSLVIQ